MLAEEITHRMQNLQEIIAQKEKVLAKSPSGTLHVHSSGNRTQFYHRDKGLRRYLKAEETELVQALCQKDYDQRVLLAAKRELHALEKLSVHYPQSSCESVYEELSVERRDRITPILLPDKEYILQWEALEYPHKPFAEDAPEYYTNKGERVRSTQKYWTN